MKAKKLFLALPLLGLLFGCNAQESAEQTYHTSKDYFMGNIVNPILDRIDGGEHSVVETKVEKATRLFKTTFSATNAHFDVTKITKDSEEYKSYIFADGKYQVSTFASADALASGKEEDMVSSTIYTSTTIYNYANENWTETSAAESTLVDYSCYNVIAKTYMESDPINIIDSFGVKNTAGVYSSSGALNMSYDNTVFELYTCTMFITYRLNKNRTNVATTNIMIRKNTKLVGAEETVGETIEYNIHVKSISGNEIKVSSQQQSEEPEENLEE